MIAGGTFPITQPLEELFQRGIVVDELGSVSEHKPVVERGVIAGKRSHHQLLLERRHLQRGKVRGSSAHLGGGCCSCDC